MERRGKKVGEGIFLFIHLFTLLFSFIIGQYNQLIAPNVQIYSTSKKKLSKYTDFLPKIEEFDLFDIEMLKTVQGVADTTAQKYLKRYNSIEEFVEKAPQVCFAIL